MNRISVRSRVDADGMLRVVVPVGSKDADREVQITIEPAPDAMMERVDYVAWLHSVVGQWRGEFEEMPQGDFETRESL